MVSTPSAPTRPGLCLSPPLLGLGLLVSWSTAFVRNEGMGVSSTTIDVHTLFYTFLAAMLALMFVGVRRCSTSKKPGPVPADCVLVMGSAIVMSLATLANAQLPVWGTLITSPVAPVVATALGSMGYAVLLISWGMTYTRLDDRQGFANGLAAFVLHALVNLALGILPDASRIAAATLLPLGSALCLRRGCFSTPEAPVAGRAYQPHDLVSFWKIALGIMAYALLLGMRSGLYIQIANPLLTALVQLVAAGCYLGLLVWLSAHHTMPSFTRCFQILLIIFATGFLLYPFSIGEDREAVAGIFSLGVALIYTLIWLASVDVARHVQAGYRMLVLIAIWFFYSAPRILGAATAHALFEGPNQAYALSLAMLYCLVMASAFLLEFQPPGIRRIFERPDDPSVQQVEPVVARCAQLSHDLGLTEREEDVMVLLCQGRTKAYIAETLHISENTVKSYARNVYAKLGVHTINELINLVRE